MTRPIFVAKQRLRPLRRNAKAQTALLIALFTVSECHGEKWPTKF